MVVEVWNRNNFVYAPEDPEIRIGKHFYFLNLHGKFEFTRIELYSTPDKKIAVYEERYTNGRTRELRQSGECQYTLIPWVTPQREYQRKKRNEGKTA